MKTKYPRCCNLKQSYIPSCIWLFLFAVSIVLLTLMNLGPKMFGYIPEKPIFQINNYYHKGYLIKTEGCKIPDLPVTTKELDSYFQCKYEGAHCNKDIVPPLVDSNLTSLYILEASLPSYNISNKSLLLCCYEELRRKEPHQGKPDNQFEFGAVCNDFKQSIAVSEEFAHVKCTYDQHQIYEDFFAFIPIKSNLTSDINEGKLNVLIIGLDSISRINFHRQMPKSVHTLKTLGFQELLGYNKIADNTYPNLIAVLTGDDVKKIRKTCRSSGKYHDKCNFIWTKYKKNGYVTSFAEDSSRMGIFNFENYGFQKQPTDYYWSFFDRISEDIIGNSKSWNVIQCIGAREGYKMIMKYINDLVHTMKKWKFPYFSFSWSSSLSHDFVNKPRIGDQLYSDFFQGMYNNGYFENTVVLVMSDHGIRFGSFRETYQGRIEERLPLLFVRLPIGFKENYPLATKNLMTNIRRLTTPFDLHETLYDLSTPENLENDFIENGIRKSKSKYGLSLFSIIPTKRTCEDAGIADHWCTCLDSQPIDITPEVKNVTIFVINYLNGLLKGYAQCAKLQLKTIKNAQLLSHAEKAIDTKVHVKDFSVSFETIPGGGSFEATVRNAKQFEIIGTVSRLNLYGNQSYCITDYLLKLYCYCNKIRS